MPSVTFGPTDDRSVQQLERCRVASGEDAPSVLCADHHPGYSMPIGGVLALKEKVMPAGVGYDIACAELFGYAAGNEWFVAHYRFRLGDVSQ